MISVDPARDSLQEIQAYVEAFDPTFLGVGGPTEAIDRVSTQYGVFYQLGEGAEEFAHDHRDHQHGDGDSADPDHHHPEADYDVDHTASIMGVGPDGALRVVWSPQVTAEDLAADLEALLS